VLPQIKIKTPAVVGFAAAMMAVIVVLVVIMTPVNKEIIRNNDDYSFQGECDDIGACSGRVVVLPFKWLPFSPPSLLPAGATHTGLITHKYYCSAKNGKLDWVLYAYELVLLVAFIKVMASWHGGVGIRFNDAQTRSHPDTPPFPSSPPLARSLPHTTDCLRRAQRAGRREGDEPHLQVHDAVHRRGRRRLRGPAGAFGSMRSHLLRHVLTH